MVRRTHVALPVALWMAGCATADAPAAPPLDLTAFFRGATAGQGVMTDRGGQVVDRFTVKSAGQTAPDGSFRLDQDIDFQLGKDRQRTWSVPLGDGAVGLTDAKGQVKVRPIPDGVRLSYAMADLRFGRMDQRLYRVDADTVVNVATIRVLGVTVRHLHEVIERVE